MRKRLGVLVVLFFLAVNAISAQEEGWVEFYNKPHARFVLPVNKAIFAAVKNEILKSVDAGKSWQRVFSLGGFNKQTNQLYYDVVNDALYAACDTGIYRSKGQMQHWERLFKDKGGATCAVVIADRIILGTKSGLFISNDNGRSWNRAVGEIGKVAINNISYAFLAQGCVYVSAFSGIFKSTDKGDNWSRIFMNYAHNDEPVDEVLPDDNQESISGSTVNYCLADKYIPDLVYVATGRGIYRSNNQGRSWDNLPEFGLTSRDIRFLSLTQRGEIIAATESEVFVYQDARWICLGNNLVCGKINSILPNDRLLFVAAEKGIFTIKLGEAYVSTGNLNPECNKGEPGIKEVQKAAIEYAELSDKKIQNWRKCATKKAWLPKLTVGVDRNSSDLWHWEGGSTTKSDDDTLRRGKDTVDWDVSLSWDFGELIWSEAQTSIDARSRLMVDLRNDILDQVNKAYFERMRIKRDLESLRIEDSKKRNDQQLKLEELTATLDGFTGGYFSAKCIKN